MQQQAYSWSTWHNVESKALEQCRRGAKAWLLETDSSGAWWVGMITDKQGRCWAWVSRSPQIWRLGVRHSWCFSRRAEICWQDRENSVFIWQSWSCVLVLDYSQYLLLSHILKSVCFMSGIITLYIMLCQEFMMSLFYKYFKHITVCFGTFS